MLKWIFVLTIKYLNYIRLINDLLNIQNLSLEGIFSRWSIQCLECWTKERNYQYMYNSHVRMHIKNLGEGLKTDSMSW